nr:hypothetical protein [Tanacetum cinerariifolium]
KVDGIFLSQDKYIGDNLKKFGFSDVRSSNTPTDKENPWGKDGFGKDVELHLYRSMIGSLMYLTTSRPDIMFAISSSFDLVAYLDSDYGGASQDRKSTTGGSQFLGRMLISWQCKKQTIVATSTTEAEYVAAASCCGQVLWIQNQLLDYCVDHIHTDENVADLLTKPFDAGRFQYLVSNLATVSYFATALFPLPVQTFPTVGKTFHEIARVLTSMDVATVLAGEANGPTGSGFIPTTGPPATIVSIGSETREYYMAIIKSYLGWRFKDFKGSKEEAERAKKQGIILEKEQEGSESAMGSCEGVSQHQTSIK